MQALYFGNWVSGITTCMLLVLLGLIAVPLARRSQIQKWGRFVLVLVLVGTALSGLSATRDAYMMEGALFAPFGGPSAICAVAGAMIYLAAILSLFVKKQGFRRAGFCLISVLLLIQVTTVEGCRIAMMIGGAL